MGFIPERHLMMIVYLHWYLQVKKTVDNTTKQHLLQFYLLSRPVMRRSSWAEALPASVACLPRRAGGT